MEEYKIIPARIEDAPLIARCIIAAVGEEHCRESLGAGHDLTELADLFAEMARREDTQYSYRNTLVAVNNKDETLGACVAYNGGHLYEMRAPFLQQMNERFGMDTSDIDDETEPGEFYIDTLHVLPKYQGLGIGKALIQAAIERGRQLGLTPGLLVDKENDTARRLYEKMGFRRVGDRPFFGIVMDHMQNAECK